ncbi:P-loop NTPase family protein [Allorhizobium taibaishanense]|uniref:DNA topology modulation protein FlaR n=1 Tax=Allorhizobium taibaishanense TaxID=887144 RepID=A0A1Q9ABE3_9HYPH|nr:DNA topology modulation protein FlaR [Allorhizobium taibaishanense]MBB4010176.1 hypothetical protein [Allorhizobium taibaishanense]OLP52177.1 DNA topology modulation protein FlaR [Allorhizobium taibaishanense]
MRPDVPVISFDALKLTSNWKQRPRPEVDALLSMALQAEAWILEGGPSLLPYALQHADAVMWPDPPEWLRAWRLLTRPLRSRGRTRPELPDGNVDWLWEQYKFAIRSLRHGGEFRDTISTRLAAAGHLSVWRIRTADDIASAVYAWCG